MVGTDRGQSVDPLRRRTMLIEFQLFSLRSNADPELNLRVAHSDGMPRLHVRATRCTGRRGDAALDDPARHWTRREITNRSASAQFGAADRRPCC